MGRQTWLISDVISVQPILNSNGLMGIQKLMALEFINALNAVLSAQKTWLRLTIPKNQLCVAINAAHGCF